MRLCVKDLTTRQLITAGACLYVGRTSPAYGGLAGSPLANPYPATGKPGATILAYRAWLWNHIRSGTPKVLAALREVHRVGAVACWCPEHGYTFTDREGRTRDGCHGAQVLKAAAWLAQLEAQSGPRPLIHRFSGEYRFLSNFYPCQVAWEGITYPSSEHAYMATKTEDAALRQVVAACTSPGAAKGLGRRLPLRAGWEAMKDNVMRGVLHAKFTQNPELGQRLANLKGVCLIEGNTWGDQVWGMTPHAVTGWEGHNRLGHALMDLAEQLAAEG